MITCCATGCTRYTGRRDTGEWLCAKHWGRLTKAERRVLFRAKRKAKRTGVWTDASERVWRALVRRSSEAGTNA